MRKSHLLAAALATSGLAGLVSGCTTDNDARAERFLVAPGKYVLYNCQQLDEQARTNERRIHELESLMAKSGSDFANDLAYRPEYLQQRGELADVRRQAAEKKCKTVPGVRPPRHGAVLR